jgi:hypothetical protein
VTLQEFKRAMHQELARQAAKVCGMDCRIAPSTIGWCTSYEQRARGLQPCYSSDSKPAALHSESDLSYYFKTPMEVDVCLNPLLRVVRLVHGRTPEETQALVDLFEGLGFEVQHTRVGSGELIKR